MKGINAQEHVTPQVPLSIEVMPQPLLTVPILVNESGPARSNCGSFQYPTRDQLFSGLFSAVLSYDNVHTADQAGKM